MMRPNASSDETPPAAYVAFHGDARVALGPLALVAAAARQAMAPGEGGVVLVLNAATGEIVDLDPRDVTDEALARYGAAVDDAPRRGRPKLGVVAREITLLPRHWDWLSSQPGGASVTLRKLVEAARKQDAGPAAARRRIEAAYRFMATMAGDRPGFEEASRALFSGAEDVLRRRIDAWPKDVADQILALLSERAGSADAADRGTSSASELEGL